MKTIRFNFKDYCFSPQWKFILLTALFISVFISLGLWQLGRAKEKQLLLQSYASQNFATSLHLAAITQDINRYRYRAIELDGFFDNEHSILIDNKFYQHQVGYQVLTPFMPSDGNKVILINRGWIPLGARRDVLPAIPSAKGNQTLRGYIYVPEKAFILGKLEDQTDAWPLRAQAIALKDFAAVLQKPLYPFVVLLAPNMPNGFIREWQPVTISPQKHRGYAVQWFSFACILFIIFISLNIKRKNER